MNMKKKRTILITIILFSMLTGCVSSGRKSELNETGDCDLSFLHHFSGLQKDEGVFFIRNLLDRTIYYLDQKSNLGGPLCPRPDCEHRDTDCSAYFSGTAFSVNSGRLYYIGEGDARQQDYDYYLYSIDTDGWNKRRLRTIDRDNYQKIETNILGVMHRGYYFYSGGTYNVHEGIAKTGGMLIAYPLDGSKEITIYDKEFDSLLDACSVSMYMQPVENDLYFMVTAEHFDPEGEDRIYELELFKWDIKGNRLEKIYEGRCPFFGFEFHIYQNAFYFSCYSNNKVFSLNVQDNTFAEICEMNSEPYPFMQLAFSDSYIIGGSSDAAKDQIIEIRDYEGRCLLRETLPFEEIRDATRVFYGMDGEAAFFSFWSIDEYDGEDITIKRLAAIPVNGESPSIIWSDREYVIERLNESKT